MKKSCVVTMMVALLVAGAATAVDLSRYYALGDSMTAGYASGSLHEYYQRRAYPAMLAQQAGTTPFELPLISAPGIDTILGLIQLNPGPVIMKVDTVQGQPINAQLEGPYNNLAVPGATVHDMLYTTGNIMNLLAGNTDNVMHDLILRNGVNTALEQAIGAQPTFITVWIGQNDVLGTVLWGTPIDGVNMTPVADFATDYANALGALATILPNTDVVVFNIGNATAVPFVSTIAPYLDVPGVGHVPLIGSNGLLPEDAYVTLGASSLMAMGYGIPVELGGSGLPLPEDIDLTTGAPGVVLRAEEIAVINQRTAELNAVIADTAAAFGYPVLDINGLFDDIVNGEYPTFGGIELTPDFLVGGIFSYDGIHPQDIGQAMIAMWLIDLINEHYGADIPQINMDEVLCDGGCADQGPPAKVKTLLPTFSKQAFHQLLELYPLRALPEKPAGRRVGGARH